MAIKLVDGRSLKFEKNAYGLEGAYLATAITSKVSEHMDAGIFKMRDVSFGWEYTFDEILYVIEGTVKVTSDEGKTYVLNGGDIIFFSKGEKVTFACESTSCCCFVRYPPQV